MDYKLIEDEFTGKVVSQQTTKQFELVSPSGKSFLVRIVDFSDGYKFITDLTGNWEDVERPSDLYNFINEEIYGIW